MRQLNHMDAKMWTVKKVTLAVWGFLVSAAMAVAAVFRVRAADGTASQQIMTSPDGVTWTARTAPSARLWQDITWSPELDLFCAVAQDGTAAQQIMTNDNAAAGISERSGA